MKIIEPSYEVLDPNILITPESYFFEKIERAARTCYQSFDSKRPLGDLTKDLISRKHDAMLEFADLTVKIIHNRGFLAEITRHRLASFAVESTRYVGYHKEKFNGEITVIRPYYLTGVEDGIKWTHWTLSMKRAEESYLGLISEKCKPQEARGVLPNDLKTEIIMKANIREWKHIFELRCSDKAHPDMHRVMIPLRDELKRIYPVIF